MTVDPKRRDEVSKALVPLLSETEQWGKMDGLKALAVWWTADALPAMIKCTQDKDFAVRWAALDALGQVKDVRAAEAAADCLATDRGAAAKALKAIGSLAEPALIKRLRDTDRAVRVEACKILGEVGTRRSLPALTALKNDKELKGHVERAIEAISARK
ncbi:MAG: HEAT repeat domain-containing protein, partial [Planctomycetes bacterium]|nr:HEAT repeat domain-containing protein [Planctomycetota bacterium]